MKIVISIVGGIFVFCYGLLAILYDHELISDESLVASIYAGGLNLINSSSAIILFEKFKDKSNSLFLIAVFGGMVFRLFFILGAIVIFLKFLNIDKYGFIFVFFGLYFCLLFVEIWYFYKQSRIKIREI